MDQDKISFSDSGSKEIEFMINATRECLQNLFEAFRNRDRLCAIRVEPLSEMVEQMTNLAKEYHVQRLQAGLCDAKSGATFFDLSNSFDRISAHAANVSLHIIKRMEANRSFDEMHGHTQQISGDDYLRIINEYEEKYLLPLK